MIELSNVTKVYSNGEHGLRNISLKIPANQLVFIAGHTGAGKTTLMNLLALRDRPTSGQVLIGEAEISGLTGRNIARYRRSIGAIFHDLPLLDDRTVGDNVALPLIIENSPQSTISSRINAALNMVGLRSKIDHYPHHLSDVEQQRANIARAIVSGSRLIIADEPTLNMDRMHSTNIMNIFKRLAGRETTVVVATHDRALLTDKRFRVIELRQGQRTDGSRPAVATDDQ